MYTDDTFDCSLFAENDPELVRQVQQVCLSLGFEGLGNIKIPWAQAKAFANRHGKLYKYMLDYNQYKSNTKNYEYKNMNIYAVEQYLTSGSFYSFFSKMSRLYTMIHKASAYQGFYKVKYGLVGEV